MADRDENVASNGEEAIAIDETEDQDYDEEEVKKGPNTHERQNNTCEEFWAREGCVNHTNEATQQG